MKTGTYKLDSTNALIEINEFRKYLITHYQNQATGQRTQAAISNRKYIADAHLAKAETYDMMVKYLQGLEIVS